MNYLQRHAVVNYQLFWSCIFIVTNIHNWIQVQYFRLEPGGGDEIAFFLTQIKCSIQLKLTIRCWLHYMLTLQKKIYNVIVEILMSILVLLISHCTINKSYIQARAFQLETSSICKNKRGTAKSGSSDSGCCKTAPNSLNKTMWYLSKRKLFCLWTFFFCLFF